MLLEEALKEFLYDCQLRKYTWKTIKGYRNGIEYLINYLKQEHDLTAIEEIASAHLKAFMAYQQNRGRKETYLNGLIKTYRSFFKYLMSEDYLTTNPVLKLRWMREPKTIIKTFTDAEVKRKPISKEKLFFTFDELLEHIKTEKEEDAFIVKSNEGIQKIRIANLAFAEVIGRNVLYHLRSGKVIECTEAFAAVCDTLMKYECFIKPHRAYLVNMQYVDTIENHQIRLQTLSTVPIAQGKAKEMKEKYLSYQMEGVFCE